MPIFKEVWNFASPGITGGTFWSEVYYVEAASITVAATFQQSFLNARLGLLHPLNKLLKIRVSDILNPRSTSLVNINQQGNRSATESPAAIDKAIVVNLTSTAAPGRRKLWLRGGNDGTDALIGDGERDPTTGNDRFGSYFLQELKNWLTALKTNNYIILVRQKANVAGFTPFKVLKVDGTIGNGQSILTLSAAPGYAVGSNIIAAQFSKKDLPALNGTFSVLAVTGANITIPYATPEGVSYNPQTGYVRALGYLGTAVIDPIASGPSYIGGRKSKGAFFGNRGAKSASRRLRSQL